MQVLVRSISRITFIIEIDHCDSQNIGYKMMDSFYQKLPILGKLLPFFKEYYILNIQDQYMASLN